MRTSVTRILTALFLAAAFVPAAASAAPGVATLDAKSLVGVMPAIAPLAAKGTIHAVPTKAHMQAYRLDASLRTVRAQLHELYRTRATLADGSRVLGFSNTRWGTSQALIGHGNSGKVVTFRADGANVVAEFDDAVYDAR